VGHDSGHGMLFHAFDGRLMLVLHHPFDGRVSKAHLYEIEDTGDPIRVKKEAGYQSWLHKCSGPIEKHPSGARAPGFMRLSRHD
jgi:hypothetical protein